MPVDKLRPFQDPRVQLRSAHLNGLTYGYIYAPRSTTAANRGTIILIHGFPDISFGWRYQIPYLTSLGLDVVAPDCIGYGRTDSPPYTISSYSYKRIADDIATLCTQLSLSTIILGGHDWGGAIIYRVAAYHPKLVTAIFSICTPYFPPTPKYDPLEILVSTRLPNFGYQIGFASGAIESACSNPTGIGQFLNNMYGARTPDGKTAFSATTGVDLALQAQITAPNKLLSKDEMDFYVQEYARHGLHGPLNWYRNREVNYMDEWHHFFKDGKDMKPDVSVKQECLFVLARKDQALKPFMAEKMGERIPRLTRKEVDAGHWALWERPEEVNALIGVWLEEKVWGKEKSKL